ncbi:MAG: prepilin-type N-terminal cleavage/methylation domain-containing protein [Coriobacteriia bacterium]|nr:prepilin-type N-terminal cleavage/methylation domain-containing protein [Coriobacteriia bacterium]
MTRATAESKIKSTQGFTLAELLIVVAIVMVLVAIAIPVFTAQIERSREATDLANVRSAYAEVKAAVLAQNGEPTEILVPLEQQEEDWQTEGTLVVGGIQHKQGEGDTVSWKGVPGANGQCRVYYDPASDVVLEWSGGDATRTYPFNINEDLFGSLNDSGLLGNRLASTSNFEIDSKCPGSTLVGPVESKMPANSLLKNGTWAYLGSGSNAAGRYLYWTSVDTNKVGAGKQIPIIIQTGDGKYYIGQSTTATRNGANGKYVAIADHLSNSDYLKNLNDDKKYPSLEAAYNAYEKLVEKDYQQYKDSLPK